MSTSTTKAWQVVRYGRPSEALDLVAVPAPVPEPGEVLVRVAASVLNYNEVDGCHGRYLTINPPLPYTLGMEFVGEVTGAGAGAEEWIGKRVMGTGRGAIGPHAELAVGPVDMCFEAPEGLDDVDAAAFFFPFHLAHLGLHERGRLQAGETVLVHAAAGGVGSAAVQLAAAAGSRVIATAGSEAKLALARKLGADVAINYRDVDFTQAVLEATDGRGADVCFDGVGGDVMMKTLPCLAWGGRHLVIGFASGIEAEEVPMVNGRALCFGNISLLGVILAYSDPSRIPPGTGFNPTPPEIGRQIQRHLEELLAQGKIRPVVSKTVPFEELPQALDEMEDRSTTGRVVVLRR